MQEIIEYLGDHGEATDAEIALATDTPLDQVQQHLVDLSARQIILTCQTTQFVKGKESRHITCRLIGFDRPIKYGRGPKAARAA